MKDETIEKVKAETADWAYLAELPDEADGFTLDREVHIHGDCYDLFTYENAAAHKSTTAYFHEETHEYKLRVAFGLISFCRIEYITHDFAEFEALLRKNFAGMLHDMAVFNPDTLGSIVRDKGILTWEFGQKLPAELEGFTRFVGPAEPEKITNGSYVVLDYVDFDLESSVTFYYNIYRDEFYGEARIWNIPDVNYTFDSRTLPEFEEKLEAHLVPRLQEIRARAIADKDKVHYRYE